MIGFMKSISKSLLVLGMYLPMSLYSQGSGSSPLPKAPESQEIFKVKAANGESIAVQTDEFKRQFLKNSNLRQKPATEADVKEHLDLYIKFKEKVLDAHLAGLDSNKAYLKELAMYREQLAKNFLYDRNVTESLIQEAHDRLKYEVKVSHILILVSPEDGEAKQKAAKARIDNIYNKLMRNPSAENFAELAKVESEDPGSNTQGGSLGYMTALQVVYEFENQAYNTPVGGISPVFKTEFGYHILRVEDKRLNRGDIKMNHIMIRVTGKDENSDIEARKRIDEIYQKILKGEEGFPVMAQNYSEDYSSRYNNGAMDYVKVTQYLGDLDRQMWVDQGFALAKDGDITAPFRTNTGYHLLQRVAVRPIGSYEQMKNFLKNEVQRNPRSRVSVDSLVSRIKRDNGYKFNKVALEALGKHLDSNFVQGKFDPNKLPAYYEVVSGTGKAQKKTKFELSGMELFRIGNRPEIEVEIFDVADFSDWLKANNRSRSGSVTDALQTAFKEYVDEIAIDYQDRYLEFFNDDFRDIYQEYREGILMFNRMQEVVWLKANTDTTGLKNFFESQKGLYRWGKRIDVEVYFCKDDAMAKSVAKQVKKGIVADSIRRFHTKKSALDFSYKIGKYEKGDSFMFAPSKVLQVLFADYENNTAPKYRKPGIYKLGMIGNQSVVVKIKGYLPEMDKTLDETRGPISSKYQERLEKDWIESLNAKFQISVNEANYREVLPALIGK